MRSLAVVGVAVAVDLLVWSGDATTRSGEEASTWLIGTVIVVVHLSLFWRGRYPWAVFAIESALALISVVVPHAQPFTGLLVALYALSARLPDARAMWPLALVAIPLGSHSYATVTVRSMTATPQVLLSFVILILVWMAVAGGVWTIARVTHRSGARAARVRALQTAQAQEEIRIERLRIARELHDSVAGSVTSMLLQAAGARAVMDHDPAQVRTSLMAIEGSGDRALGELQRLLRLLRAVDPASDEATRGVPPRVRDIPDLVAASRDSGLEVRLVQEGEVAPLDAGVELTAYRVVQEGLTNMHKYAARGQGEVRLRWLPSSLEVSVRNTAPARRHGSAADTLLHGLHDGPGHQERTSTGLGLAGLAERVELIGGLFSCGAVEDGFELCAVLPRRTFSDRMKHVALPNEERSS